MKKNYKLDDLKRVKKVEAPPFLLSRIEARLEKRAQEVPLRWVYAAAASLTLLFCLNVFSLNSHNNQGSSASELEEFVEEMGLIDSNQLYYE